MSFRKIFRVVLLIIVVTGTFVSCSNDDSKNTVDDVTDSVKDGVWKISYFYDSGKDETQDYAGYNFTFDDNTVLTASKEMNSYTGVWSVSKSTSDDDLYSTIFNIAFGSPDILIDLSDDWKVIENTGTSLKLKDDSKGDSAIDYLTFEKIEQ